VYCGEILRCSFSIAPGWSRGPPDVQEYCRLIVRLACAATVIIVCVLHEGRRCEMISRLREELLPRPQLPL
jgi:hypothetical protein